MPSFFIVILSIFMGSYSVEAGENPICPPLQQSSFSSDISGVEAMVRLDESGSLDCFIKNLPEKVKAFRTYVYRSNSLQGATMVNPRAIVSAQNGGMVFTFNGNRNQKGYDEIEVIAVDNSINPTRWKAGSITTQNGRLIYNDREQKCSKCHGQPLRPIWGKYPDWPGVFGSIDDWLPDPLGHIKDSQFYWSDHKEDRLSSAHVAQALKESKAFRKFKKLAKDHPRYKYLEMTSDNTSPVYPYTEVYRIRNNAFRPNLLFGSVLAKRQNQILLRRLRNHPFYRKFSNSIQFIENCDLPDEMPEFDLDLKWVLERFDQEFKNLFGEKPTKIYSYDYTNNIQIPTKLHYYPLYGFKDHELTLFFAESIKYLDSQSTQYSTGFLSLPGPVLRDLLFEMIDQWADAEKFLRPPYEVSYDDESYSEHIRQGRERSQFFSWFDSLYISHPMDSFLAYNYRRRWGLGDYSDKTQQDLYKELCLNLVKKSRTELKQNAGTHYPVLPPPAQKPVIQNCIDCHGGDNSVAPPIPFGDKQALKKYAENAYGAYDVFESLVELRVQDLRGPGHLGGDQMPLGREPLTAEQINELIEYISD